jgi:hypothetical protein
METKIMAFESAITSFVPSNPIGTQLEPPQSLGPETIIDDVNERAIISCSMDTIGDEPLAELVIDGVRKFREIIPAIVELRKRFNDRPRGHAGIAGCSTRSSPRNASGKESPATAAA